jgi:Fe-S oxidoreductase
MYPEDVVPEIKFDPEVCIRCETVDCLMKCQYIRFAGISEAKAEKLKINAGEESRVLNECLTCYACQEYCPYSNNPFYLLVERQEEKDILPAPRPILEEQLRMMRPKGRITPQKVRSPVVDMCAFPMLAGCVRGRLFEGASVISGNDIFCNIMWLHFAKNSVIRERVPKMIDNIMSFYLTDSGIDEVVCFHDECYGTYTSVADAYGISVPFKPVHLFDYINRRLDQLTDRIKPVNEKIAYQRPCSNRLSPESDRILDEIFVKIGAERVPRKHDRENALCCGGVPRAQQRDELADELVEKNISDMLSTGARYCVFNCPFCMATLGQEVAEHGLMPVLVSDLVLTALGE